ncbi:hypothetical protein [Pedobacter psychroterrae]|nr:hypothetical protein [Pedobacter psychroterrae]
MQKNELTYFDLKGYFEQESIRLSKAAPLIVKTVRVNDSSETKTTRIADWRKELEIFKDADINKTAWKGLFKITKVNGDQQYTTDNEKIPVKELTIIYKKGSTQLNALKGFRIVVKNINLLYHSTDTLIYYPDSIYQVKKAQNILFLSDKRYQISGKFP